MEVALSKRPLKLGQGWAIKSQLYGMELLIHALVSDEQFY